MNILRTCIAGLALSLTLLAIGCVATTHDAMRPEAATHVEESGFVRIGGIDQWISIHGDNPANPVLLILHGGPGMTNAPFAPAMKSWQADFVVVNWDQRGAGRTFGHDRTGQGEMTFDRIAKDGIELAEYLRSRLDKRKIVVLAMSAGSITGLTMIQARPDLFSAYVGAGQFVDTKEGDAVGYRLTLDRARAAGNSEAVTALEAMGPPPWSDPKSRSAAKGWAGRTTPASDPASRMNVPTMLKSLPDYTEADVRDALDGFAFSERTMLAQPLVFNVRSLGTRFRVPIFIFQGAEDLNTPTSVVVRWFEEIKAPTKKMTLIDNASHGAFYTHSAELGRFLAQSVKPVAAKSK